LTTNLFLVENIAWLHSRISVFGFQRSPASGTRSRSSLHAWWR